MGKELRWGPIEIVLDFLIEHTPVENLPVTDGIFVFGHIQPLVAHHAARLWKEKKSDKMIIVGDKGSYPMPPAFPTKADFYAALVKERGVPENALILERESGNVLENVLFGLKTCHVLDFFPKSLTLCALPPLLKRCEATFQKQFPNIAVYKSAFPMPSAIVFLWQLNHPLSLLKNVHRFTHKRILRKVSTRRGRIPLTTFTPPVTELC